MKNSIEYFSKSIKNNPLLTREEEIKLSKLAKQGNKEARKKLIESNFRLVFSIAKKYHKQGVSFDDLVQESSLGLIKAVDKFDPDLGYKFSTYATWWIKQSTLSYLNNSQNEIKVPTHYKIILNRVKLKVKEINIKTRKKPTIDQVSKELDISKKVILKAIKTRFTIVDFDSKNNENSYTQEEKMYDENQNPEKKLIDKELKCIIEESLKLLSPREEKIIRLRFGLEKPENIEDFILSEEEIEKLTK